MCGAGSDPWPLPRQDALFLALLEEHYDHGAIERERDHAGKLELLVSEVP
jgi:hypothetical protein